MPAGGKDWTCKKYHRDRKEDGRLSVVEGVLHRECRPRVGGQKRTECRASGTPRDRTALGDNPSVAIGHVVVGLEVDDAILLGILLMLSVAILALAVVGVEVE